MMNAAAQVTHFQALEVGKVFAAHPDVSSVSVVGSVARDKRGNDLDMVVVTNGLCYATFVTKVLNVVRPAAVRYDYYAHREVRRRTALAALKFDAGFRGWLELATRGVVLDIHLMPSGWQMNTDEVQRHLPHRDPNFVRNIAKDAVTITSQFYWDDTVFKEVCWP